MKKQYIFISALIIIIIVAVVFYMWQRSKEPTENTVCPSGQTRSYVGGDWTCTPKGSMVPL